MNIEEIRAKAETGDVAAQLKLGDMYFLGQGVPLDDHEAAKWYRQAAESGDAEAQLNLGVMYFNGFGVTEDKEMARYWFNK